MQFTFPKYVIRQMLMAGIISNFIQKQLLRKQFFRTVYRLQ